MQGMLSIVLQESKMNHPGTLARGGRWLWIQFLNDDDISY